MRFLQGKLDKRMYDASKSQRRVKKEKRTIHSSMGDAIGFKMRMLEEQRESIQESSRMGSRSWSLRCNGLGPV